MAAAMWAGAAESASSSARPRVAAVAAGSQADTKPQAAKAAAAPGHRRPVKAAAAGGEPAGKDTVLAARIVDLSFALDSVRTATGVPAIAAAVIERGRVVAAGVTGVANGTGTRMVKLTDPFHVGPVAKAMTATAIATLVDDGVLHWRLTVGEAFPELKDEMEEVYAGVTLEQLLGHRGRIPAYTGLPEETLEELRALPGTSVEQRSAFVARVLDESRQKETNFWQASDAAYTIAAAMAERAAKTPWETLMQKRLFDPLRMKNAGLGWPATAKRKDAPLGHRCDEESVKALAAKREAERVAGVTAEAAEELGVQNAEGIPLPEGVTLPECPCAPELPGDRASLPGALSPAADVHCSVVDLARFAAYHLRGSMPTGARPLMGPDNWARLHTDLDGNHEGYGIGWELLPENEELALLQEGGVGSFFCRVIVCPGEGRAVVVVTNGGEPNGKTACEAGAGVARAWRSTASVLAKGER